MEDCMRDENLTPLRMFGTVLHYDDFVRLTLDEQTELRNIWASTTVERSRFRENSVQCLEQADELLFRYEHKLLGGHRSNFDRSPLEKNGTVLNNATVVRLTTSQQLDLLDIWGGSAPRRSHLCEEDVFRLQQGDELIYRYDRDLLGEPSVSPDRDSLAKDGTALYNAALVRLTPTEQGALLVIWRRSDLANSKLDASLQLLSRQTDELVYRYKEGILEEPTVGKEGERTSPQ
jgi:hypothetical protein